MGGCSGSCEGLAVSIPETAWWVRMLASDNPQLPSLWLMQMWLNLGWAVVTAWLGCALVQRLSPRKPWIVGVTLACALWVWLPGPYASSYWLGLAFQLPSISAVLLCGVLLWTLAGGDRCQTPAVHSAQWHQAERGCAVAGVALSACLALDTFALFPVPLYAWGFSGVAVVVALGLSLLPWVASRNGRCGVMLWIAPLAIALFVVLRLPTGNLWDALLDPWLGVGLAVYLWRHRSCR